MPTYRHLTAFIGAAAVASTLGIAALVSTGIAGATTTDDMFVSALAEHGITPPSTQEAVSLAADVCTMFDQGLAYDAVNSVSTTTDLVEDDAAFFVGLSVGTYCPAHTADLG